MTAHSRQSAPCAASPHYRITWNDIEPRYLEELILQAKEEDLSGRGLRRKPVSTGDQSTLALTADIGTRATADIVNRKELVPCGLRLLPMILRLYTPQGIPVPRVRLHAQDGQFLPKGTKLASIRGHAATILSAERIILNFLQHLSGISTLTRLYVQAMGKTRTKLLDTRKTTPGYRILEKYAVATGGAWNHRLGLYDRVLLKDNHLALLQYKRNKPQPIAAAIAEAKRKAPKLPVEVEVDTISQIPLILDAGADIIMLDNFTPAQARRARDLIKNRALIEASGGITLKTLSKYAKLNLTYISTGALVHQSTWVDIGLDWQQ